MRETQFIDQNKEKWAEFEDMLRQNHRDPERLNDLFVQITDDLSYARTFYPNRSVRMYLNSMAQRIFHDVYRGKRFPRERFRTFWTQDLPTVMWESRKALWLAFGIFLLAFGIGVLSSIINPDFARIILGDDYVEMTLRNIENGDPLGVYKESRPFGMSVGIAANNLFVALQTALFGVLASIGTLFYLMYNGIMVGAFQYFFIERGLFWDSFLTIWIHGTLEISAIIIAGAAGLVMGSGLLFPGTYARARAFQISLRKGLKIFIGIAPIIILAGIFEGFLTRYTETPDVIRGTFILLSFVFVVWYFFWYPWHVAGRRGREESASPDLPPDRTLAINFYAIKNAGEVLSDAFTVLKRHQQTTWLGIFGTAILYALLVFTVSDKAPAEMFTYTSDGLGVFDGAKDFFSSRHLFSMCVQIALLTTLLWSAFRALEKEMPPGLLDTMPIIRRVVLFLTLTLPVYAFVQVIMIPSNMLVWLLGIFVFPIILLWAAILYFDTPNPFSALGRTFGTIQFGQSILLGFLYVSIGMMLFLFFGTPIWDAVLGFFSWLVPPGEEHMRNFTAVVLTIVGASVINFIFLLMALSAALQLYSNLEISDALSLREGIQKVGTGRQIRGLARE